MYRCLCIKHIVKNVYFLLNSVEFTGNLKQVPEWPGKKWRDLCCVRAPSCGRNKKKVRKGIVWPSVQLYDWAVSMRITYMPWMYIKMNYIEENSSAFHSYNLVSNIISSLISVGSQMTYYKISPLNCTIGDILTCDCSSYGSKCFLLYPLINKQNFAFMYKYADKSLLSYCLICKQLKVKHKMIHLNSSDVGKTDYNIL